MSVILVDDNPTVVIEEESTTVVVAEKGFTVVSVAEQGEQGIDGNDGLDGGLYLFHDQTTPAASVTIPHNFTVRPAVTILIGGVEVDASVEHLDANSVYLEFPSPMAFQAILTA